MGKQSITVLLVEDEPTLGMIITDTLTENGFIIHAAPDGEKGLRDFFQLRRYFGNRCNDAANGWFRDGTPHQAN